MTQLNALVLVLLLCPTVALHADTVTLKDGTVREGVIIQQDGDGVMLEVKVGALKGRVVIPKNEIQSIQREEVAADPLDLEAEKLQKVAEGKTGKEAAESWVKLGELHAGRTGYSSLAQDAFRKAVAADPEHATARKRLGHVKTAKGWQALDDEHRAHGLVPLDDFWVKPQERSALIDRRHQDEVDGLRIGPRQEVPEDKFSQADLEKLKAMRKIEAELSRRERLRVQYGESLLSRYGYYASGDGPYIGSGRTPYYTEGVGLSTGDTEFFVGRVYSDFYGPERSWLGVPVSGTELVAEGNSTSSFRRNFGYSPGLVWGDFAFGTGFHSSMYSGGHGHSNGYHSGAGFGADLSGGSKNFRYNIRWGGW